MQMRLFRGNDRRDAIAMPRYFYNSIRIITLHIVLTDCNRINTIAGEKENGRGRVVIAVSLGGIGKSVIAQ